MKLIIYFNNNQAKVPVDYNLKHMFRHAIKQTLRFESVDRNCELSVTFVDNEHIRTMNREYRNIDKETDVLSFPTGCLYDSAYDSVDNVPLGDIVISLEKCREQGIMYGHGFNREFVFLTVHSALHLLGYDHETSEEDEIEMRGIQTKITAMCGYPVKNNELRNSN